MSREREPWFPSPGSGPAVAQGCRCPEFDNGYGRGYLGGIEDEDGKPMFVVNFECPLHGAEHASGEQVISRASHSQAKP